jgi:UDP-3-O-[3-hydroxymyristoyl] glucosamine N-acyltransferase
VKKTVGEIASLVGGEILGPEDVTIRGISGIREANKGDITFLANPKYAPLLALTRASAIIVAKDVDPPDSKTIIRTENPSLAFMRLLELLGPKQEKAVPGVHATVVCGKDVVLGKDIAIGPYAVLEDGVRVGDYSVIGAGSFVGRGSTLGSDCIIYPGVVIRERIEIGNRVLIHSGSVIGSDGFGFILIEGKYSKVPQVGTVLIEDDVEIGANVTIDRARFERTLIRRGSKIDNLVQIAHNVTIGEDCVIVAQAGIAGSTSLGKGVTVAAQAGCVGHLQVGDGAILAAQAGVTKDVNAGDFVIGSPAIHHLKFKRNVANINRLPKLQARVEELERKIEEMAALMPWKSKRQ